MPMSVDKSISFSASQSVPRIPRQFKIGIDTKRNTGATDPTDPYVPKGSETVATKIVAADGSAEFTDIQLAIDALPAGGGVVYIKEGTYTISTTVLIIKSNVTIRGAGNSTLINSTTTTPIQIGDGSTSVTRVSIESCRFETIATDVCIYVNVASNTLVFNCFFAGASLVGVYSQGSCDGLSVQNCTFEDLQYALQFFSSNALISGCMFSGCTLGGVALASSNSTVAFNVFVNVNGGCILFANSSDHCTVIGNVIRGGTGYGIYLNDVAFIVVSSNSIKNNDGSAITLFSSPYCIINANDCLENGDHGIDIKSGCSQTIVTGNVSILNTTSQIEDAGSNTTIAHNVTS